MNSQIFGVGVSVEYRKKPYFELDKTFL